MKRPLKKVVFVVPYKKGNERRKKRYMNTNNGNCQFYYTFLLNIIL